MTLPTPTPEGVLIDALRDIAAAQPPTGDCTCGHRPEFCHKAAANRYCGGATSWAVWRARAALEAIGQPYEYGVLVVPLARHNPNKDTT